MEKPPTYADAALYNPTNSHRVFEEFLTTYQPILSRVEDYLEEVIERTAPLYARAYVTWKNSLHEVLTGAYLMARKIPLPNKENFINALKMFSFESSIHFLQDICRLCGVDISLDWEEKFRESIGNLLFLSAKMLREQQQTFSR